MQNNLSKVLIGIPSLGRYDSICKNTLSVVGNLGIDVKVFVEPQELQMYQSSCGEDKVVSLDKSCMGVGYVRTAIRRYAKSKGYKYLFEMDDDVTEIVHYLTDDKSVSVTKTIEDCVAIMEMCRYVGGIRITKYCNYLKSTLHHKWSEFNNLIVSSVFLRVECSPDVELYKHHEDTITSIALWEKGYCTLMYGLAGIKFLQYDNKGGCCVEHRDFMSEEAIELIMKDFPHISRRNGQGRVSHCLNDSYYRSKYKSCKIGIDSDKLMTAFIMSKMKSIYSQQFVNQ